MLLKCKTSVNLNRVSNFRQKRVPKLLEFLFFGVNFLESILRCLQSEIFSCTIPFKNTTIEELKVFHQLLHDLKISRKFIAAKLELQKESKFKVGSGKETLNN